jgi:hypothetical protein
VRGDTSRISQIETLTIRNIKLRSALSDWLWLLGRRTAYISRLLSNVKETKANSYRLLLDAANIQPHKGDGLESGTKLALSSAGTSKKKMEGAKDHA